MNNIKEAFTINDLENISGIKAHTIRIWEKRYDILQPERLSRNVRLYNNASLQKILNVALLNKHGLKISKIAQLSEEEIILKTREFVNQTFKNDKALVLLKLCMYNFDTSLFNQIYAEQLQSKTFSEIFIELYIPFLEFVGLNWQTSSISPAHEHFISNLIYQKIQVNIEKLEWNTKEETQETYVLYLPEEEMHEIGILYFNYELLLRNKKTIYLGRSIPISDLVSLRKQFENIVWVSQFTVSPKSDQIAEYLEQVKELLIDKNNEYWAISYRMDQVEINSEQKALKTFTSIEEAIKNL
ncbi:MerR family transcriptional regulator [Arcticibacterium luteifluviistationis]|uniref:MerR family transcriptional regulator n=1 Tax=Arcticibacterium luteifluviistationis TaxID=1784714 RepID=UPI0013A6C004|nr:MerR family transcriptional regulator [Arcticibacterium luteifluviistationis]